LNSTAPIW